MDMLKGQIAKSNNGIERSKYITFGLPAGSVAEAQALAARHSTLDELVMLTTHGLLHLLGFDHAEPEEEREMFGLQKQLILDFAAAERRRPRA